MLADTPTPLDHLNELGDDRTPVQDDLIETSVRACSKNTAKSVRCLRGLAHA